MRNITNRLILTLLILTCISSVVIPVYADTDGTELQVVEPQKLEIQLGQSWAGVEFTLKTDAGMYPNAIPVDETGVLKLEIGGSKSYVLTAIGGLAAGFINGMLGTGGGIIPCHTDDFNAR